MIKFFQFETWDGICGTSVWIWVNCSPETTGNRHHYNQNVSSLNSNDFIRLTPDDRGTPRSVSEMINFQPKDEIVDVLIIDH